MWVTDLPTGLIKENVLFKGQSHGSVLFWMGTGIFVCLGTGAFPLHEHFGAWVAGVYVGVLVVLAGITVWYVKRK